MELYDAGLTGLYLSESYALIAMAEVIGKDRFVTVHCTADDATRLDRNEKKVQVSRPRSSTDVTVYESPENPDLVLDTSSKTIAECVASVVELLQGKKIIR